MVALHLKPGLHGLAGPKRVVKTAAASTDSPPRGPRPVVMRPLGAPSTTAAAGAASSLSSASSRDRLATMMAESSLQDFPTDVDFKWAQDSYNVTQRNTDTWVFFAVFRTRLWLLEQKWSYPGGFTDEKRSARARSLASYLLDSILNLGPTFIKVGQLCSTRSDLFPAEFVDELGKLQDRVPAFSADKAEAIIERDLGQPVSKLFRSFDRRPIAAASLGQLFRSFDRRPIAAASLGQVHRAVLLTGEEVVVKVQRPGLKQLFDIDLNNLRILAEQLDKGDENRDFKGIYQECAAVLYDEIDYINEGRNADRFRRNFRDTPWVRTPVVHWEFSSPRVLTLEYLPGVKITDMQRLQAGGIPTELVARRATEAYLMQVLRHGFFHADPHPGNVSVDAQGRLLFYDYGMMGEIVPNVRERLLDVFYGIYKKDTNGVIRALVELGVITPTGDMLSIRRAIGYFLENITRQTERQEAIGKIGEDLFAIAIDQPFRFPATFTFVLRAFSTLEGIGKTLNPAYNFSEVATPYAQELLQLQDVGQQGFIIEQLQQQATEVTQAAAAMPLRVARIDSTLEQLETGNLKLRVRVLEGERAARRQGVLQVATINTIAAVGLLDVGTQLALHGGQEFAAGACYSLAALFSVFVTLGFKRVQRLDKFEKDIRG
ncbi:hypothetical protein OEZ85_002567 [Tetradesmus obliquus]|uniref:ABC1 atypical kinase-like domain-containing protein n=1 Tax=Tetradesmus obliquus TaxID=3088 RepID=A0ABY8TYC8_TETOB|nr:hypothetical protein OEZ85_002567 [Tetradesmus obliquus]